MQLGDALWQREILNLGCGRDLRPDAVNLDSVADCGPDLVHDLTAFPWPLPDNHFREVFCLDVLEHLPDTVRTMEEIHRICRPNARVVITTPHYTCANAYTDPTHRHQFGMFSFDYFTGSAKHNHYTNVRFAYNRRQLVFHPTRKNTLIRRLANLRPEFYERHLGWMLPAWFMSIELRVVK